MSVLLYRYCTHSLFFFLSLHPVSWPLNSWWWVCPPLWFVLLIGVRMQMLWQLECSVHTQTHTFFRHRGGMNWGEVSAGRLVKKDWRVGCAALFTLVGIFPARHGYKILFECGYSLQESVLRISCRNKKIWQMKTPSKSTLAVNAVVNVFILVSSCCELCHWNH